MLADIDTVDFPDLEKLIAIVTTSSDSVIPLLQVLSQKAKKFSQLRGHKSMKASMISLFSKTFLTNGHLLEARKVFKDYRGDEAFSTTSLLLAYDSIIACQQAHELAILIWKDMLIECPLPTLQDIVLDPLNLYYIVKVLHLSAENNSLMLEHCSIGKIEDCRRILKELSMSFKLSDTSESCEWIEFQFLRIAYMLGIGCSGSDVKKSLERIVEYHIVHILPSAPQYYNANMIKFYNHVAKLLYKFQEATTIESWYHINSIAIVAKTLELEYDSLNGVEEKVYFSWLLYSMALIEKEHFILVVAQFIESFGSHGGYFYDLTKNDTIPKIINKDRKIAEVYERYPLDATHWVAWKLLAVLLGPIDETLYLTQDKPISPDSALAAYFPDLMLATQKVKDLTGTANLQVEIGEDFVNNFEENHNWWLESILSPANLDALSAVIVVENYQEIVDSLPSRFDDIEHMYEIDLRYLYKEQRGVQINEWNVLDTVLAESFGDDADGNGGRLSILFEDKVRLSDHTQGLSFVERLVNGDVIKNFDDFRSKEEESPVNHSPAKVTLSSIQLNMPKLMDNLTNSRLPSSESIFCVRSQDSTTTDHVHIMEESTHQLAELRSFFLTRRFKKLGNSKLPAENVDLYMTHNEFRPLLQLFEQYTAPDSLNCMDFAVMRVKHLIHKYSGDCKHIGRSLYGRLQSQETVFLLGSRILEILTYQALVSCHLTKGQDNLFLIRVVQILVTNVLLSHEESHKASAIRCLTFLYFHNINIDRALFIATECAFARIDPSVPPKPIYVLPADQPAVCGNVKDLYQPLPFV